MKHIRTLFAGLDWASKTHVVCVVDDDGQIKIRFEIRTPARRSPAWSSD